MNTYRICTIEGDGIGHEVVPAAVEVLEATGLSFEFIEAEAGWSCFVSTGSALPVETLEKIKACDSVLFGAITSPPYRVEGYFSPIRALRRELDLYANLRPVDSWPIPASREGIDLLIVRENSEGMYAGREECDGEVATALRVITRRASERIVRLACEQARRRRRKLTVVHKANVLTETCGLFRRVAYEMTAGYPELEVNELFIDAMAMRLIKDPETFDVIVTTNLFGDILSDEAAMLVGGLGLAPSGNIGASADVFEPVHGSAPDIAGRGIANPIATVLSAAMMLDHLNEGPTASRLRQAIRLLLKEGPKTPDLGGRATTREVTRFLAQAV